MSKEVALKNLKKNWFKLAAKEDYPKTPEITEELNMLTIAIEDLQMAGSAS